MAVRIGALFASLSASSAKFERDMGKASKAVRSNSARMNKSLARVERGFGRVGARMKKMAKSMLSLRGGFALAAGATGIGLMIKRSIDFADKIAKTADAMGISTDTLQEYRFAAGLAGVETEVLDKGLIQLSKAFGEARVGTGTLTTFLRATDKALLEQFRVTTNNTKGFNLFFRALADTANMQDRMALSNAGFTRSGKTMINMVRNGIGELEAFMQKARDLGLVIEERLLRGAEGAADNLSILGQVLAVKATAAVLEHAAAIGRLAEKLTEAIPKLIDMITRFGEFTGIIKKSPIGKVEEDIAKVTAEFKRLEERLSDIAAMGGLESFFAFGLAGPSRGIKAIKFELEKINTELQRLGVLRDNLIIDAERLARRNAPLPELPVIDLGGAPPLPPSAAESDAVARIRARRAEEIKRLFEETRTAAERFAVTQAKLNEMLRQGRIDQDLYNRALAQAQERLDAASESMDAAAESSEGFALAGDAVDDVLTRISDDLLRGEGSWRDWGVAAIQAIQRIISEMIRAKATGDALGSLFKAALGLVTSLFPAAGGSVSGSVGAGTGAPIALRHGGSFRVGGAGGADSQLVAFRASPDERVDVLTPAQQRGAREGSAVAVHQQIVIQTGVAQTVRAEMMSLLPAFRAEATAGIVEAFHDNPRLFRG